MLIISSWKQYTKKQLFIISNLYSRNVKMSYFIIDQFIDYRPAVLVYKKNRMIVL